ncbi:MAG: preprotein translocase subunit SecG [candidate division Zixibacteria bacterium]|nr:preprotein translocase subunit SecG [candidate division Zixibacteria bacterium]
MYAILTTIHVIICLGLILTILMQSAKGEGLAGAFGGSSLSGAVFGGRGAASFLSRATSVVAIAFMISCLVLTFMSPSRQSGSQESAIKEQMQSGQQTVPADQPTGLPGEETPTSGDVELPPAPGGDQTPPDEGE